MKAAGAFNGRPREVRTRHNMPADIRLPVPICERFRGLQMLDLERQGRLDARLDEPIRHRNNDDDHSYSKPEIDHAALKDS
jgi:hypothetical protein